jgi:uncharacterized protein YyaL (SSP411 family)
VNRLATETSPYLRQHRDNPVDWYPWGEDAFAAARERNVPILLSVGYSACHWCHVMAHESFEDVDVAQAMNDTFVNIKVDREERPDVDAIYMDAVQSLTGRGGWPMTVAMDAEGRPFWGGTYFPRDSFLKLIDALDDVWKNRRSELDTQAEQLVSALGQSALTQPGIMPPLTVLDSALSQIIAAFDEEWGGFGQAPKFPSTSLLEFVLRGYMESGDANAKHIVTVSLDAMASGGMYDHIGGGFARYSVDREWLVPHFEKMLYDQALLVRTYRQAHTVFGLPRYRQIVEETIEYVLRELRHPDGGFYSAQDADSPDENGQGVEGLFHTWTPTEARAALSGLSTDEIESALRWYDITDDGNFDGRSIPNRMMHRGDSERTPEIDKARQLLFDARSQRAKPGLDDKVLTEWNAMFLLTLADAAAVFQRSDWRDAAVANGEFLLRELRNDEGVWMRSWQADGSPRARHRALAADHAALVEAFVRLAELTGEARWVRAARETADAMIAHFWDPANGGLFTTADDAESLVVRRKDFYENATPSANSTAAHGLLRLASLTGNTHYLTYVDRILQLIGTMIERAPSATSNAMLALDLRQRGLTELALIGDVPEMVHLAQTMWRPDLVMTWGERYDSPLWNQRSDGFAYVCRNSSCQLPVNTVEGLFAMIAGRPPGSNPAATVPDE